LWSPSEINRDRESFCDYLCRQIIIQGYYHSSEVLLDIGDRPVVIVLGKSNLLQK
jgi:hypothetical protein